MFYWDKSFSRTYVPVNQFVSIKACLIPLNETSISLNANHFPLNEKSIPLNEKHFSLNEKSIPLNANHFPLNEKPNPFNAKHFPLNETSIPLNAKHFSLNEKSNPFNANPFSLNEMFIPFSGPGELFSMWLLFPNDNTISFLPMENVCRCDINKHCQYFSIATCSHLLNNVTLLSEQLLYPPDEIA